ncbi:MAG TPA: MarR family transcriptional regulator [Bacteroidales bacterium]|nr:MarR family transcriptional regulator [Bacteroidales bacterium]
MNEELHSMIDLFTRILHLYSVIDKKPRDFGTGDLLYVTEIHAMHYIAANPEINVTQLAEISGVTKGAISQTIKRLVSKRYIARYKAKNKKEVNLRLSDKGYIINQKYEEFEKERFVFAEKLYENASKEDIILIKNLFSTIYENMKQMSEY